MGTGITSTMGTGITSTMGVGMPSTMSHGIQSTMTTGQHFGTGSNLASEYLCGYHTDLKSGIKPPASTFVID